MYWIRNYCVHRFSPKLLKFLQGVKRTRKPEPPIKATDIIDLFLFRILFCICSRESMNSQAMYLMKGSFLLTVLYATADVRFIKESSNLLSKALGMNFSVPVLGSVKFLLFILITIRLKTRNSFSLTKTVKAMFHLSLTNRHLAFCIYESQSNSVDTIEFLGEQ